MSLLVNVRWLTPVMVQFGNGAIRRFECVHDALDCLQHEWPSPRGKAHARAIERLCAALARLGPIDEAREAFVAACEETGILARATVPKRRAAAHAQDVRRSPFAGALKPGRT